MLTRRRTLGQDSQAEEEEVELPRVGTINYSLIWI